jgi:ankyrin repeat protein
MKHSVILMIALCLWALGGCGSLEPFQADSEAPAAAALADRKEPAAGWRYYAHAEEYGLRVLSSPQGAVTGPIEVQGTAREDVEIAASLQDTRTGKWVAGVLSARHAGAGWVLSVPFPQSGTYELSLMGRSRSEAGNKYYILAVARFDVKLDTSSNWYFYSVFKKMGLTLASAPKREVAETVEIQVSCPKEVEVDCMLKETLSGKDIYPAATILKQDSGWRISVSFPDSGDYELLLISKTRAETSYTLVAKAQFTATLGGGASERLVRAVKMKSLERMQKALESGADPNTPVKGYRDYTIQGEGKVVVDATPAFAVLLWYKATDNQIAALRLLKSRGANFKALTSEGSPLLSEFFDVCFFSGKLQELIELFNALIELGADPAQETGYRYISNGKPEHSKISVLLHMQAFGFKKAAELAAFVPLLIQGGASPDPLWPWGDTALESLFGRLDEGSAPLIRAHIEAGADPNPDELRAMAWAAGSSKFNGDFDIISFTLSHTSHVNDLDKHGFALLHSIIRYDPITPPIRGKLFDLLAARGADFNRSDRYGRTPLMTAVNEANLAAVNELLARGVDPKRAGSTGMNVFHVLPADKPEVTAKLIDRFLSLGVNINARDSEGASPLRSIVEAGDYLDLVKLLVSKGANPALPDLDGFTAYGEAKSLERKNVATYLGSLKVPEAVGGWPVGNASPACKAVLTADLAAIVRLPIKDLQDRSARTADGVPATPLHLAAERGDLKVIRELSSRKVDWNIGDRYGRSPLETALFAGKADAVAALLASGADPNHRDNTGESAYSRAIASRSPLLETLLASGKAPEWRTIALALVVAAPLEQVKKLAPKEPWPSGLLDTAAILGRTDILAALGSGEELGAEAKKSADEFAAYDAAPGPGKGRPVAEAWKNKKGSYTLTLEEFSPWLEPDPELDLKKYPVAVYVPKGYDGSRPYGLMISMMNAKGSSQQPKPEYLATLDSHRLLYVGFDPYNGVFEGSSIIETSHERLALAAVYHMFGAYNVDRRRVYLTGFSWGGRLAGEIVPRQPRIFTGGIAVGGCFVSGARVIPSYPFARRNAAMVLATGDWDYNRMETYYGYNTFLVLGYEAHYFQEPQRGHKRISGDLFEKAVTLLDEAAAARAHRAP